MQFKYIYTVYTQVNLGQGNQFKSTVTYYKFKIDVVGE